MPLRKYKNHFPQIKESAFIDDSAVVIGRVIVGENSSIWCNAVARGDVSDIIIGNNSNIQDLTMLHVTHDNPNKQGSETPLTIGDNVTIGHNCCIHACTIKSNTFIGMGATILDKAIINKNVMIGAGSLVPQNKELESGYLYFGNPVKQIRALTDDEIKHIEYSAAHYVKIAKSHK